MDSRHYDNNKLRILRERRGESQKAVGQALNIHRQTIYRAESGLGVPYEVLCDLAAHYDIEVITLLYPTPLAHSDLVAA